MSCVCSVCVQFTDIPVWFQAKSDPEYKQQIWHLAAGLIFKNYNKLLEEGFLVQCSNGNTRDLAMLLALWQGDQLEIDSLCQLIHVHMSYIFVNVLCLF